MTKRTAKTIEFPSEEEYLTLKAQATMNKKKIGEFIVFLLKFWEENKEK
ncbi:MAG: hypothetical protein ACFFC7_02960 [Candidatus Hermodarchaeota archaeon]